MKSLEDLLVLDLTRVLAGPYASMILSDFGANVVKIETPLIGDDSRGFGPFIGTESAYFISLNRGKRSITLNLKAKKAQDIFKEMVKKADIVIENYRPGVMEKFGLGYEDLKKINSKLIYTSCSGFGCTGPYKDKPAYDVIVQGMGGIMSLTGHEDSEPTRVGASIGDITAGLFAVIGTMIALHYREISGEGQKVDVSMLDCQVAILENALARYFSSGIVPKPIGNRHPSITPFEAFKAKDGYIIIAIGNDKLWQKFCNIINYPEFINDERFITNQQRTINQKILRTFLLKVFIEKDVDEWLSIFNNVGIPCGPINSIDKLIDDPQIKHREMIVETEHPIAGKVKMAGIPIKLSKTPGTIGVSSPNLGQHNAEILSELLGLTDIEVKNLKEKGIL